MSRSGKAQEADNALVLSFTAVRRALGLLGLALPPMLLLVVWTTHQTLQSSISAYYYGAGGNILVGTLCAMAVFLWSYLGYQSDDGLFPSDKLVSRVAAAAILIVAFVPTGTDPVATTQTCTFVECLVLTLTPFNPTHVHLAAALTFFAMLAVFCLVNFRRRGGTAPTPEKRVKNLAYLICGLVIVVCLALLIWRGVVYSGASDAGKSALRQDITVFLLESTAVWAFSISWLIKGDIHKMFRG